MGCSHQEGASPPPGRAGVLPLGKPPNANASTDTSDRQCGREGPQCVQEKRTYWKEVSEDCSRRKLLWVRTQAWLCPSRWTGCLGGREARGKSEPGAASRRL